MEKFDDNNNIEILEEKSARVVHEVFPDEVVSINENIAIFQYDNFPKNLKKRPFEGFDSRFASTLLFSLILHILLIYFAPRFLHQEQSEQRIKKVQKNFVDLLLKDEIVFHETEGSEIEGEIWGSLDEEASNELTRLIEDIVNGVLKGGEDIPDLSDFSDKIATKEKIDKMVETLLPTVEERRSKRLKDASNRDRNLTDVSSRISKIGLLGLITSGSGAVNYEYIADILESASKNSRDFELVLSKLKALKIPRYEQKNIPERITDGLKNGRAVHNDKSAFYNSVAPLAQVKATPIVRKTMEDSEGNFLLAGLSRKKATNGKARSPKHLAKIVAGHNIAIQDCYKKVLKHQPGLKGKITVRIVIDPEGNVVMAEILNSTIHNPKIEKCMLNRIRRWRNFGRCNPKIGNVSFKQTYRFGD